MTMQNNNAPPELNGVLRNFMLYVPPEINAASGIKFMGKLIKSLVFTTDACVIRNVDADAVLAVYPFTPQSIILEAVMKAAEVPVIAGVGGGLTKGKRVVELAKDAEFRGAVGVVVNAPTSDATVSELRETVDIPVIVTVISDNDDIPARLNAGASAFNVSAAANTAGIVAKIRAIDKKIPVIATGGPAPQTINETISAGANAITWTPPSNGDVFKGIMAAYREGKPHP